MTSRPRVRSAALRRLQGHNKSLDRSSSSSMSKQKGGAKSTGRKERDRPSSRQEKPAEARARTERSRSKSRSKSTSRHRSRSPVHRRKPLQERFTNIEHNHSRPNSPRPRNYDIEKSLKVLIRKQEESMKHMQRLEEKINRAKTRNQGSGKAKQTPAEFQYKRNKIQNELNAEVIDKIEEAMEADEPVERNCVLREGKGLLEHRNKCLLMAEKYGWGVVEHYETEPLAENSDDEKKIRKAIKKGRAKKEQSKIVTNVRKDTSKPYTNISKPYFRAIPQANATFRPNNGAQANTLIFQ